MVDFVTGLRCRECQRPFPAEALHVCDYCFGPLEVAYDEMARDRGRGLLYLPILNYSTGDLDHVYD